MFKEGFREGRTTPCPHPVNNFIKFPNLYFDILILEWEIAARAKIHFQNIQLEPKRAKKLDIEIFLIKNNTKYIE